MLSKGTTVCLWEFLNLVVESPQWEVSSSPPYFLLKIGSYATRIFCKSKRVLTFQKAQLFVSFHEFLPLAVLEISFRLTRLIIFAIVWHLEHVIEQAALALRHFNFLG